MLLPSSVSSARRAEERPVQLEALCSLLEHGRWVNERCPCACCASVCRVCGTGSRSSCVSSFEQALGWQATRLAVKKP